MFFCEFITEAFTQRSQSALGTGAPKLKPAFHVRSPSYLKSLIESLPIHLAERARLYGLGRVRGLGTESNATASSPGLPTHSDLPVVYWTHHAMRHDENPALEVASQLAQKLGSTLLVYYGISENYRFASDRHHLFSLQGARDLQQNCRSKGFGWWRTLIGEIIEFRR